MKRKPKAKTYAQLKRELDRVFSIWVRKRDSTNGLNTCISCGLVAPWPKLQAGHFVKRSVLATRWDERNVWPQCVQCNIFKKGNYPDYAISLTIAKGAGWLVKLVDDSRKPTKLTRADLQALIVKYSDPLPEATFEKADISTKDSSSQCNS